MVGVTRAHIRRVKRQIAKQSGDAFVPVDAGRLRIARNAEGLTVSELSRRSGVRQQTLDLIVRGKTRRSRRERLAKLATALHVGVDYLTGEAPVEAIVSPLHFLRTVVHWIGDPGWPGWQVFDRQRVLTELTRVARKELTVPPSSRIRRKRAAPQRKAQR